jgi:hypothetical protein
VSESGRRLKGSIVSLKNTGSAGDDSMLTPRLKLVLSLAWPKLWEQAGLVAGHVMNRYRLEKAGKGISYKIATSGWRVF